MKSNSGLMSVFQQINFRDEGSAMPLKKILICSVLALEDLLCNGFQKVKSVLFLDVSKSVSQPRIVEERIPLKEGRGEVYPCLISRSLDIW